MKPRTRRFLIGLAAFLVVAETLLLAYLPDIPYGTGAPQFYIGPSTITLSSQAPNYRVEVPPQAALYVLVTIPAQGYNGLQPSVTDVLFFNDTMFHKEFSTGSCCYNVGAYSYWATADIKVKPNTTISFTISEGGLYHVGFGGFQPQNAPSASFVLYSLPTLYLGVPFTQALGVGVAILAAFLTSVLSLSPIMGNSPKVLVSRFKEGGQWFVRLRCVEGNIDSCSTEFGSTVLVTKDKQQRAIQLMAGGGANYMFWAGDPPDEDDDREVIVRERGKAIFRQSFGELTMTEA